MNKEKLQKIFGKCDCESMSCVVGCDRKHTHHQFSCGKCSYTDRESLLISQSHQQGRMEMAEEIEEKMSRLTRYYRSKFVLHLPDCCKQKTIGVEEEPLFDMLLESEVMNIINNLKTNTPTLEVER